MPSDRGQPSNAPPPAFLQSVGTSAGRAGYSSPASSLRWDWMNPAPPLVTSPSDGRVPSRTLLPTAAPILGFVVAALLVVRRTMAPRLNGVTDELIFRGTLEDMHRGRGFYPAYRDALAAQGVAGSQVRAFRLPTEFLLLRPFPVSTYRLLAATVVMASIVLCWRLAAQASPVVQALVLVGSGLWLSELLTAVYLYAEIWALPFFLLGLLAARYDRWTLVAVAFTAAACVREMYLPIILIALAFAPTGRRRGLLVGLGVALALGTVHYGLAHDQLVAVGNEAPFNGFANFTSSLRTILSPRPGQPEIELPVGAMTIMGAVGVARSWRCDVSARILGTTSVLLALATLYAGRPYWPLLFSPGLIAYLGAPWRVRSSPVPRSKSGPAGPQAAAGS